MALTPAQVTASANAMMQIANSIKAAFNRAQEFTTYNSNTDPGWSQLATNIPAAMDPVNTGCVLGTQMTPAQVSAAIGSLAMFVNYYTGTNAVSQSAWGNNIEAISNPIV